ncbi:MAG TPA: tetratricopeptide repeat protein [Gemmatimonadales bacterium]|nr:tetratricopeptide repeat protein [Gemmatimonadales bacterium]
MRHILVVAGTLVLAVVPAAAAQKVKVTESIDQLEARVRADSNDAAAHYNVALGYFSRKRYADAEQELRTATSIDPQFADAYLAMSIVRNWDEEYWKQLRKSGGEQAVRDAQEQHNREFRRAFLADPLVDIKILGGTYKITGYSRTLQGLQDLVEGRYDRAYDRFDQEITSSLKYQPLDSIPWVIIWLRGLAGARLERYDPAITDFSELLTRTERATPTDSIVQLQLMANEYRYVLAALHQRAGHNDRAVQLYQAVATADMGNYMAHAQLARMYEAGRDWDRAVAERQAAVSANPGDSSLLLDLGITLGKAGRFGDAVESLNEAVAANPREIRALYYLGLAEQQQGHAEQARAAFTRFLAQAPSRYERQITSAKERLHAME